MEITMSSLKLNQIVSTNISDLQIIAEAHFGDRFENKIQFSFLSMRKYFEM